MAWVYCPECQTRISDQAAACPHCGYTCHDGPLALLASQWPPAQKQMGGAALVEQIDRIFPISAVQRQNLDRIAENLVRVCPSLCQTIQAAVPGKLLVADITAEVKKQIASGALRFSVNDNGISATLLNGNGKFAKQLKLKELRFAPDLAPALANLQTQMALAQILTEIREVQEALTSLHRELQNDRLALADSVFQQLQQAILISDSRLREEKLLQLQSTATDARCQLAWAFAAQRQALDLQEKRGRRGLGKNVEKNSEKSAELFTSLSALTRMAFVEAAAYSYLNQPSAARQSLQQFRDFIDSQALDDPNTLLTLDSYSRSSHADVIGQFAGLRARIDSLPATIEPPGPLPEVLFEEREEAVL